MRAMSLSRRLIPSVVLIVVLAATAVLWHNLPTPTAVYAPFDVHGSMGAPVMGRGVSATVTRVCIADRLSDALGRDRSSVTATGRRNSGRRGRAMRAPSTRPTSSPLVPWPTSMGDVWRLGGILIPPPPSACTGDGSHRGPCASW